MPDQIKQQVQIKIGVCQLYYVWEDHLRQNAGRVKNGQKNGRLNEVKLCVW